MNLIFNAESLRPPITGVGNYSFHLLQELMRASLVDEVHSFTGTGWQDGATQIAVTEELKADTGAAGPGGKQRAVAGIRQAIGKIPGTRALYDALMDKRFRQYADSLSNAVYHETNYILKPYKGPCITTVHDLSHVRFPQFHPEDVVKRLDHLLPKTLERADLVIAVSNVVRQEILEHYDIPADRVHTIYEGVEQCYVPRTEEQTSDVLSRYGLSHKHYVLLVATLEPRKGIDVLLDAWELLPEPLRRAYPLVLTGSSGWRNEGLRQRMEKLLAGGTVRHLGYVPAEVLPQLYSGATVFSYPSVYEGFGLPVLDAMSSGVPVICRAGTSMAEFSEGACLLCDTGDAAELAGKLDGLLQDTDAQKDWSARGLARASLFSWGRCARETAELYETLV